MFDKTNRLFLGTLPTSIKTLTECNIVVLKRLSADFQIFIFYWCTPFYQLNCSNRLCYHSITCQRKSCDAEYKRLKNIFFHVSSEATYYERDKMSAITCSIHNNLIQFILLNGFLSKQCKKKKGFCSFMLYAYEMI